MATLAYGRFYGETIAAHKGAGFLVSQTAHQPNLRVESHRHATPYFCLVIQGGFDENSCLGARACGPSSLLFHPDGHWHEDVLYKNGAICLNIQLNDGWDSALTTARPLVSTAGPLAWLATRLLLAFRDGDAERIDIMTTSLLHAVANRRGSGGAPAWLRTARRSLQARSSEDIALSALAEEAAVHPLYLARRYRRHFGMSVGEDLRIIRTKEAAARLAASETPLAELAVACGFYDQSHLTNVFKKQTGLTPGEYRQLYRS